MRILELNTNDIDPKSEKFLIQLPKLYSNRSSKTTVKIILHPYPPVTTFYCHIFFSFIIVCLITENDNDIEHNI